MLQPIRGAGSLASVLQHAGMLLHGMQHSQPLLGKGSMTHRAYSIATLH